MSLKLIADDKIPRVAEFFTECDDIVFVPGEKITRAHLKDADILLTRTVTTVDAHLLTHSSIKFVGTATTGTDHVDEQWLLKNNISFAHAAGANSTAVAEYVFCCLAALKKHHILRGKNLVAGVVGCGRIGRIVATLLQRCGFEVICYDPLLTEKLNFQFTTLEKLISESDVITLHTPLTRTGYYPTLHMINEALIKKIKKNAVLINTSRGSVIDQFALINTDNITLCLDVWENEPDISLELLRKVTIGTPHIAGYSLCAKYRATQMIFEKAAVFFGWNEKRFAQQEEQTQQKIHFSVDKMSEVALTHYNPLVHTEQFKCALLEKQRTFDEERKNYRLRDGFL